MAIRLLLADDHALLREGIRARLDRFSDLEVVGEASNGKEVLECLEANAVDVVLLDVSMPVMSGLEVVKQLKQRKSPVKVVVLSMHENPEYVKQMIAAGVKGYVLKDSSSDDLARAVREVHGGAAYFSPRISLEIADAMGTVSSKKSRNIELSRREIEVLSMIAGSYRNKEIAKKLQLSVRTIETHRCRIMKKLGLRSVAGLTRYAISLGIVALHERKN